VRKWALPVVLALLVVVAFAVGSEVRERLGFSFSLAGLAALREWVGGLGWYGPAVFVGLVTFRTFLLLSSHVVLILGGLVFGALGGTLWGALGLVASALLQFLAARVLGEDWVRPRLGDRHAALEDRVRRLGPAPVWAITAHPAGPQTPVNLAAGLVGLPIWEFALAVTLAAPLRAGAYAVLGTGILSWGLAASIGVGLGLVVLLFVPLMIPTVRSWALGTQVGAGARSADAPGGERGRDVRVDRELRSRQHGG
jgi:uncharacterized membrane protein YdjX (TVP38/TMEM64 family)